jgi:predicted ribosomally synthesized peptide with SipW-like signal peptide
MFGGHPKVGSHSYVGGYFVKQQKSKKVRAILAGGLVLGVGAAVTLAAWNDSEFAKETFTAGSFNLQGSASGAVGSYTDHATADGAVDLVFSDVFSNLAPGDTAYAPYWLRLDSNSTVNGSLTLGGVSVSETGGSNADAISYRITEVTDGETCGKDETPDTAVASGLDLNTEPAGAETISLVANAAGTEGTAVQLCIAVTAAADTFEQGVVTTATWQFDAESKTAS